MIIGDGILTPAISGNILYIYKYIFDTLAFNKVTENAVADLGIMYALHAGLISRLQMMLTYICASLTRLCYDP